MRMPRNLRDLFEDFLFEDEKQRSLLDLIVNKDYAGLYLTQYPYKNEYLDWFEKQGLAEKYSISSRSLLLMYILDIYNMDINEYISKGPVMPGNFAGMQKLGYDFSDIIIGESSAKQNDGRTFDPKALSDIEMNNLTVTRFYMDDTKSSTFTKNIVNKLHSIKAYFKITQNCCSYSFKPWGDKAENIIMLDGYLPCPIEHLVEVLPNIKFDQPIKKVGSYAYKESSIEQYPQILNKVEEIGTEAFSRTKIKNLILPEGLKKIGSHAFYQSALETAKLPATLEIMDEHAFGECKNLKVVDMRCKVKTITQGTFTFCRNIDKIILPPQLEVIGKDAFEFTKIKKLDLPSTVHTIGSHAFTESYVEEINLENVKVLEEFCFKYHKLSVIRLSEGLTIEEGAFLCPQVPCTVYLPNDYRNWEYTIAEIFGANTCGNTEASDLLTFIYQGKQYTYKELIEQVGDSGNQN